MSRIQVDSGIPFRREQPQTQVIDTFVGLRAPGPQLQQAAQLPRWQSELFDVAQALGGLSNSLNSLSRTWGDIGSKQETQVGEQQFAMLSAEEKRNAAAMEWAELEKRNPQLKGASPWRKLAIRQAAGKALVEQQLGAILRDNAERLSDPGSEEDPRAFAAEQLKSLMESTDSFYTRDAVMRYGGDMTDRFANMVEEAKRKRTVLVNNQHFQSEVRDLLTTALSDPSWPEDFSGSVAARVKEIQDNYYTITGESGNLAVFESVQGLAETLIASGRYDDARELIRGMSDYSHNGEIAFGKLYAEQFAEIIDKADQKEMNDSRGRRQDDAYKLSMAATNAMFELDAETMTNLTEGDIKALARGAVEKGGFGPEYFGEMYDSLLQIRDGQLQRLNRGQDADREDMRLLTDITSAAMEPGADIPALTDMAINAYATGAWSKDTFFRALTALEVAKDHFGDSASPLVREQRERLKFWTSPQHLPPSAAPEYTKIVSDLNAEFDDRIIAAREDVIRELNEKKIAVTPGAINKFLGDKARAITNEMLTRAESQFQAFRDKYEPQAMMKEYQASSELLKNLSSNTSQLMGEMARAQRAVSNNNVAEALRADQINVRIALRDQARKYLREFSDKGFEGQELHDKVDGAVEKWFDSHVMQFLEMANSKTLDPVLHSNNKEWPLWATARALNSLRAETGKLPAVPGESWGLTQASRFGNSFRDWIGELDTKDPESLAEARTKTKDEARKFVAQVGSPKANNITISEGNIMRDGEVDADATATYWNAKVKWDGLSIAEIRTGKTDEGLTIIPRYMLSRHTRIKELGTEAKLLEAVRQYERDKTGAMAELMEALPYVYNARDIADFLRVNLKDIGETE